MNGNSGCHIAVVIFNLQVIDSDVLPSGKLFAHQPPETVFADERTTAVVVVRLRIESVFVDNTAFDYA